jgi:hypothetical protein
MGTYMNTVLLPDPHLKSISLTDAQWIKIKAELQPAHPPSVFMVRDKMKRTLGFLPRWHREVEHTEAYSSAKTNIVLDFYSENKRTMFLLRFGGIIGNE